MPDSLRTVYDAVQALRRREQELRTIGEADQAYRSLLAGELHQTWELSKRLDALRQEKARRLARTTPRVDEELSPLGPDPGTATLSDPPREQVSLPPGPLSEERRRLTRQVRQFHFVWRIDDTLLSLVNEIVADENRPLGEALALLPWDAFDVQTGESETARTKRLEEWFATLVEYRATLELQVNEIEMHHRDSLGIWEHWKVRDRDKEGQDDWREFIEAARKAEQATAARLHQEIKKLEARLHPAEEKR